MPSIDDLPAQPSLVVRSFLDGLQRVLGEDLIGLYLYGALTFPDSQDTIGDIDFHVIVRHGLDDGMRQALHALNGEIQTAASQVDLELDGYYIRLDATRHTVPPAHELWPLVRHAPSDESWALHCAHIRAGRCIAVYGPDPLQIYPQSAWPEIEAALRGEIRFVEQVIDQHAAYAVLNACRLLYSFAEKDVVISKRSATRLVRAGVGAEWHLLIDTALAAYERGGPSDQAVRRAGNVRRFVDLVWSEIAHTS